MLPVLAVVVPAYNEEAVLEATAAGLIAVLDDLKTKGKIDISSFIYFVDDGSRDRTWEIIARLHKENDVVKGLKLSRNTGHQNALFAGLLQVKDRSICVISMDADMQDDLSTIETMVDCFSEGYDVVYGVRKERDNDSFFKKYTALFFYRLMQWMGVELIFNHADCRLTSRKVVDCLSDFREVNLFLRGIIPLIGFRSTEVYYRRNRRYAGESKYPLGKMVSFALNGITSFSVAPLRIVTLSGFLVSLLAMMLSLWVLYGYFRGDTVPGWASTVLPFYLLGGFQILSLGLIGEYIGKIYQEIKARPRFIKDTELF